MDPATLAAAAVATLAPYLAKAGETAATKIGEGIAGGAGKLFDWLKGKLVGRGEEALNDLAEAPEREENQVDLKKQLTKTLAAQPELQPELHALLQTIPTAGPIMSQIVSGQGAMGSQVSGSGNKLSMTNRSVNVGRDMVGSVAQTGDNNVATLTRTTLPPSTSVDMAAVLAELRAVLTARQTPETPKIGRALDDATDEIAKPEPEKAEVAGALERAVGAFKKAGDYAGSADKIIGLVTKAAGWVGAAHASALLAAIGVTL